MQTFKFIPAGLTNEYRLLLVCARKDLSEKQLEEARSAIGYGLDWDALEHHANRHGLSPVLYRHLQRSFPAELPNQQKQRLKVLENSVRNLSLSAALLKILQSLNAAGVRALAYKGPALAALLYGDIGLRAMSDLDILIDRSNFHAAEKVLMELGYQATFAHTPKQQDARLRSDCECEFFDADGKMMVDLHWQIIPSHLAQRFIFDELWQRRRMVEFGRRFVPTLSAEDTALALAVHGGKHLWQRLNWLADFAEVARQNLDWQALSLGARHARAERMLLLALALATEVLQVPIPSEFRAAIAGDEVVRSIAPGIARKLFEDTGYENDSDQSRSHWLTLLQLADNRWDGMRSAARFAFGSGPREWQAVRLPDSLFAAYRLLRIATLMRTAPSLLPNGRRASRSSG